jgi:hypothetical protein
MISDLVQNLKTQEAEESTGFLLTPLGSLPGTTSRSRSMERISKQKLSAMPTPIIESPESANIEVLSMDELASLLGGKRSLPKVNTLVDGKELSPMKPKASTENEKKDKKTTNAKLKKYCKDIDKSMVTGDRPAKGKKVYTLDEMKIHARELGLSPTGTKDALAKSILDKMKEIGC